MIINFAPLVAIIKTLFLLMTVVKFISLAVADQVICSWTGPKGTSSSADNFTEFCTAPRMTGIHDNHARYSFDYL